MLVTTDILAEGLNLQDATRLINYDLHWNPVRLMQRIGRVDRRMNPMIEARIVADHPEQAKLRGKVEFWNFLPPDELDELLKLFQRVANKTLVISRTLGIEGRKLLKPDDEFDPVKELNEQCDGTLSDTEKLRLEYNDLVQGASRPRRRVAEDAAESSSLAKPRPQPGTRAVFFCHRIPRPDANLVPAAKASRRAALVGRRRLHRLVVLRSRRQPRPRRSRRHRRLHPLRARRRRAIARSIAPRFPTCARKSRSSSSPTISARCKLPWASARC